MKVPMRYQATLYDCVPTCFVNALTFLFDREDIPPTVIHHVHVYSYDMIGKDNALGLGTSCISAQLVAQWIESFRTDSFRVRYEFLEEDEVHVGKDNPLDPCLQEGGVVLCRIRMGWFWHFMLALESDANQILFFDPAFRRSIRGTSGKVKRLESDGYGPNLGITRAWLDRRCSSRERFCLGPVKEREALLLWKED